MDLLKRIVKIGKVTDVSGTSARVQLDGYVSDWLHVLQRRDEIVEVTVQTADGHTHEATAKVVSWMPKVNDMVVCVYLPIENSDGFIIGGV